MANNEMDLQIMIDIIEQFASQRRYTLVPIKSCVLHINQSGLGSLSQFDMCGEQINTVDEVTHLGIVLDKRSTDNLATVHFNPCSTVCSTVCSNAAAYLMENQLHLPALLHIAISKNNSI